MMFDSDEYSEIALMKKQRYAALDVMENPASIFDELENSMYAALQCYSNVHRGSGQFSQASTYLYEQARRIMLRLLNLDEKKYQLIFCTPRRFEIYTRQIEKSDYQAVTSKEIGLGLGVCALAVKTTALKKIRKMDSGGGAVRLVSRRWTVWADAPERQEAGTPPVINVLGFVRALLLLKECAGERFDEWLDEPVGVDEIFLDDMLPAGGMDLLHSLRGSLIGRDLPVPVSTGKTRYVNLDNAASTPAFEAVWQSARLALRQTPNTQKEIVCRVKEICAEYLDAPQADYEIIFVSSTTEAINLAAALLPDAAEDEQRVVLNTLLEHHSNDLPWRELPETELIRTRINAEGFIDLTQMEKLLCAYNLHGEHGKKRIHLAAVNAASNVLGSFSPLDAISRLAHRYGAHLLVDAAQLVAHRKYSLSQNGADYFAFSGHKIYAPFGCGVLLVRKALILAGSSAEKMIEAAQKSGEENVLGIAALGKALLLMMRIGLEEVAAEETRLTGKLLDGLTKLGAQVFGVQGTASAYFAEKGPVIAFSLPGVPHNLAVRELAEEGAIGVRDGCFCAHLLGKQLMHIHPLRERLADLFTLLFPVSGSPILPGMIRVSIGLENDEEDIDHFLNMLRIINARPRSALNRKIATLYNGTPFSGTSALTTEMDRFLQERLECVFGLNLCTSAGQGISDAMLKK